MHTWYRMAVRSGGAPHPMARATRMWCCSTARDDSSYSALNYALIYGENTRSSEGEAEVDEEGLRLAMEVMASPNVVARIPWYPELE